MRGRLEYRVGTTTVNSSVAEVLAGGSGVCQDFAHVLISLCRHVGLPARYVSGYLGSVGEATASHAWTEAYVPPYGWLGIDATLGTLCTGQHVKVGVGRDYADVAVLRGTYQGGGQAELEVQVSCESLGGVDPAAQLRGSGDEPVARLVAIQNLGAMRQFQRGAVMTQAMGGMTETLAVEELPPPRVQPRLEDGPPTQQPQQQQQQLGAGRMRLRVGCRFEHEATDAHRGGRPRRAAPRSAGTSSRSAGAASRRSGRRASSTSTATAAGGSCCRREPRHSSYDALATVPPDPEPVPGPSDVQHRIEALPDELLHWLLASRLCESDLLSDQAWELFGGRRAGGGARAGGLRLDPRQHRVRRRERADHGNGRRSSSGAAACAATSPTWA